MSTIQHAAPDRPRLTARRGRGVAGFASRLPVLFIALVAWEYGARALGTPFFPPLSTILTRFVSDWLSGPWYRLFLSDAFLGDAVPTIGRLIAGFSLGTALGVLIGSLIALLPRVGATLEPTVRFGMSVPAPALLPLAIAFFGLGDGGKIFFIAFGAIWPVIVNTAAGLRNADPVPVASARSLVLPPALWFFRFRLPLASPQIMAGIRVAVNASVLLIVVAELYAATSGIGFFIVSTQRNFDTVGTWSGVFLLALVGIISNSLFVIVEQRVMKWQINPRETQQ